MDDARELRRQILQRVGLFFTSTQRASATFTNAAVASARKEEEGVWLTVKEGVWLTVKEGPASVDLLLTFKTFGETIALVGVRDVT